MVINLGIIGLSEGNGHPYSWSAIFNGYNHEKMQNCGFPVIPEYLSKQKWPDAKITDACVTHVWTQDRGLSNSIASAALIQNIASSADEFIGAVNAVLLARDDAENHLKFATPLLEAGIPIYIDKPIALSVDDLDKIYSLERYPGQIFTCSALRYSKELTLSDSERHEIGEIREIHAMTPKSWDKYSVHIIEPVLGILNQDDIVIKTEALPVKNRGGMLSVTWKSGIVTRFFAMGESIIAPLSIRVMGSKGYKDLVFKDSFSAFKCALQHFIDGIRSQSVMSSPEFNRTVVSLIEAGRRLK